MFCSMIVRYNLAIIELTNDSTVPKFYLLSSVFPLSCLHDNFGWSLNIKCFRLLLHLIVLPLLPHRSPSLILIQRWDFVIFIFCEFEQFEVSLAFFIKPCILCVTKHLISTYTCTKILIPYIENGILHVLRICSHIFNKGHVHEIREAEAES